MAKLFNLDQGTLFISFLRLYRLRNYFTAIPTSLIGSVDADIIKRVRDVLSDATMSEILDEDLQGPAAFRAAVVQQIVMLCTRLRVSLLIVDKLMSVANSLAKDAASA
jgi:hypothetical protein